eukprot:s951_g3.t3
MGESEAQWLEDMGFEESDVAAALAEAAGDADEALSALRKRKLATDDAEVAETRAAKKTPTSLEVEGLPCRAVGSQLLLQLPQLGVDGQSLEVMMTSCISTRGMTCCPPVGRVRKDGSMLLEVDEWIRELFDATPPLAGTTRLKGFHASAAADALREQRPWLWQGFATEKEVQDAAAEMDDLRERGVLKAANADTTGAQKARSDRVAFLELDNEKSPKCLLLFRRMEAAVATLRWSEGGQLLRPKFGMAAVYDKGGSYAPHRDNERTGQRLRQWVNFRALTAVIYAWAPFFSTARVNPSGFTSPEDGGQLRCHLGAKIDDLNGATALEVLDVAPRGGLAVLFPARRVLHEVLPSFRQRYALTLWFVAPGAGLD